MDFAKRSRRVAYIFVLLDASSKFVRLYMIKTATGKILSENC